MRLQVGQSASFRTPAVTSQPKPTFKLKAWYPLRLVILRVLSVSRAALKELGEERLIRSAKPVSNAEDFSHYLQKVPGAYMLLGCRTPGQETIKSLYISLFGFEEEALLRNVALFVQTVIDFFGFAYLPSDEVQLQWTWGDQK